MPPKEVFFLKLKDVMNKAIDIIKNNSLAFAFVFYQLIIGIRIFIEMEYLTTHIFVHQLFWFNSVLAFFFLFFKKLLKVDADRLWVLAGGSFLTFIPIVYSRLKGSIWGLNYIEPVSFSQVCRDLFTLLFRHPYNWPMFPELLALFIISVIAAFFFTRSWFMSIFVPVCALYISFLTLGFAWISVSPEHPALFSFTTSFPHQQFYALEMITLFSILSIISFSSELLEVTKIIKHRLYFVLSLIVAVLSFQGLFMFLFIKKIYLADIVVSFIPLSIIILTAGALLKPDWREKTVIPLIVAALSIAVLV